VLAAAILARDRALVPQLLRDGFVTPHAVLHSDD